MAPPRPPAAPARRRLAILLAACVLAPTWAAGCAPAGHARAGARVLAGLRAAGIPDSTAELLAAAGSHSCPEGGSREVRVDTLMAHGDLQQVHGTVAYHRCGAGGLELDGTLFTQVTRHALGVGRQRITTQVNGRLEVGPGDSCAVDLGGLDPGSGRGPTTMVGSVCGLPARLGA